MRPTATAFGAPSGSWRAATTTAAGGLGAACAASIARIRSGGRNGFCRDTTSESSGISDRKFSGVIPEMAITGRFGTRSRNVAIRSKPLAPCRKISTIARSKLDRANSFTADATLSASTISKPLMRSTMEIIVRTLAWSSTTSTRGIEALPDRSCGQLTTKFPDFSGFAGIIRPVVKRRLPARPSSSAGFVG